MTPNSESTLSWLRFTTARWPSPPPPARYSATMAPIVARTIPISMPVRMAGSALGKSMNRMRWSGLVCRVAARSRWSGSTERIPAWAPTTIGKNANIAATATFELVPKPNQSRSSGMMATLGSTWNATM